MIRRDVVQVTRRPSRPQIGALLARRVHRLEVLVEPSNLATGGVAVRAGLHQQPARTVLRGLRVVTLVDRGHRSEHGLGRGCSGHANQVVPISPSVQQPLCRRQPIQRIRSRPGVNASRHRRRRIRNRTCCGIPSLTSERAHDSASPAPMPPAGYAARVQRLGRARPATVATRPTWASNQPPREYAGIGCREDLGSSDPRAPALRSAEKHPRVQA